LAQVLKGCLAAKNRFKSKLSSHKYTNTLSKLVATSKDELKAAKAAEQRKDKVPLLFSAVLADPVHFDRIRILSLNKTLNPDLI
jgi:hypothetical protein